MKTRNLLIGIILVMILALFVSGKNTSIPVDVIYEEPIEIEYWMTQPFDTNTYLAEEPLEVEDWMTQPFV